jgi:hypothetical protein
MVIIRTNAVEVSIQAVLPVSSVGLASAANAGSMLNSKAVQIKAAKPNSLVDIRINVTLLVP